jgi:hypothetical protein
MKLASFSASANPVKGSFSPEDGDVIRLDFTQGAHGRAFCDGHAYDLPDPKAQLVTVSHPAGTLEITGPQGTAAPMGTVVVRSLKARGDVALPVLRAERLDLVHSSVAANEITGPKSDSDPEMEPDKVTNIRLMDSNLICKGDLVFLNIEADDHRPSLVKAGYLEGVTTQGRLTLQANNLMIYVLDAYEVRVGETDGCRVGEIYCGRVLKQTGLGESRATSPVRDDDLVRGLGTLMCEDRIESPRDPELDAQGFEM